MDFQITDNQKRLQQRCRALAADFATRSAAHDRDATHPTENYDRLRQEGFYAPMYPQRWEDGVAVCSLTHLPLKRSRKAVRQRRWRLICTYRLSDP